VSLFPKLLPTEPQRHAFLWTPGVGMQDLGALHGLTSSVAYDINNAGQVVGRSFSADPIIVPPTDPEYRSRAFLWAPGQGMQELGPLSGGYAVAYAINDAGQVVGRSWLSTFTPPPYGQHVRAVLWTPNQGIRDLGGLWGGPITALRTVSTIWTGGRRERLGASVQGLPAPGVPVGHRPDGSTRRQPGSRRRETSTISSRS
jgi:probable HAF family extracellular repeat protein